MKYRGHCVHCETNGIKLCPAFEKKENSYLLSAISITTTGRLNFAFLQRLLLFQALLYFAFASCCVDWLRATKDRGRACCRWRSWSSSSSRSGRSFFSRYTTRLQGQFGPLFGRFYDRTSKELRNRVQSSNINVGTSFDGTFSTAERSLTIAAVRTIAVSSIRRAFPIAAKR